MKDYLLNLWNGGLDPSSADPSQLRQRRTISSACMLMIPIAVVLILVETLIFHQPLSQNLLIGTGIVLGMAGLDLQARTGQLAFAVHPFLFALWAAPTAIIFDLGLNTTNWVWLIPVGLVANLLEDRLAGILWTFMSMASITIASVLTLNGTMPLGLRPETHAVAVSVAGNLLIILLALAGFAFRTAQARTEQQLNRNLTELQQENAERLKAERQAQAGERAKSVFLAAISHELRTPLNGVIGASELLSSTRLDPEQEELVRVVTDSGTVLLDLINNVLDLSKLEANRVELDPRPFDPARLIEGVITPLIMLGRQKGVKVEFLNATSLPPYLLGDGSQLRQILLNLCGNALKFTHQGSVSVDASYESGELTIIVRDTGIGISADEQQRLFQPFSQASTEINERYGGTGLGLTICHQLTRLMKGSLTLESQKGLGTTFMVVLPLEVTDAPAEEITSEPAPTVSRDRRLTILVTDDNAVNRLVVSRMLKQMNFEVVEANNGAEAVDMVASDASIDLILMDVQMPVMDGFAATEHIRALPGPRNSIPIIALTAHAMASDREKLLSAGMNEYLSKPVTRKQLESAIESFQLT
ncbi:MAG: response regulator [Pseudomonadales bacterium]|nr:response regulator [Pseudomonadales bacterium]